MQASTRGQEQGEELIQLLEAGRHDSVVGVKRKTRPSEAWRTQPGERELGRDAPRSMSLLPNAGYLIGIPGFILSPYSQAGLSCRRERTAMKHSHRPV